MKAVSALLLLVLAGCTDSPEFIREQQRKIEKELPRGCVFKDLGPYRSLKSVVVVHCTGQQTWTTNFEWRQGSGKTAHTERAVSVIIQ